MEPLAAWLAADDEQFQMAAVAALQRVGPQAAATLPRGLASRHDAVREAAHTALLSLGRRAAQPLLDDFRLEHAGQLLAIIEQLDPYWYLRESANPHFAALRKTREPRQQLRTTQSPTELTQATAALVEIGRICAHIALFEIRQRPGDEADGIQAAKTLALVEVSRLTPEAFMLVIANLGDMTLNEQNSLASAFQENGSTAVSVIADELAAADSRGRQLIIGLLGRLGAHAEIRAAVVARLADERPSVRDGIRAAVVKMGEPALPLLIDQIKDDASAQRIAGMLVEIVNNDTAAIKSLLKYLLHEQPAIAAAIRSVVMANGEPALPFLAESRASADAAWQAEMDALLAEIADTDTDARNAIIQHVAAKTDLGTQLLKVCEPLVPILAKELAGDAGPAGTSLRERAERRELLQKALTSFASRDTQSLEFVAGQSVAGDGSLAGIVAAAAEELGEPAIPGLRDLFARYAPLRPEVGGALLAFHAAAVPAFAELLCRDDPKTRSAAAALIPHLRVDTDAPDSEIQKWPRIIIDTDGQTVAMDPGTSDLFARQFVDREPAQRDVALASLRETTPAFLEQLYDAQVRWAAALREQDHVPTPSAILATCPLHLRNWEWSFLRDGQPVVRVANPGYPVDDLAISPDGTQIATVGEQKVVVWDVASGEEAFTLLGREAEPVNCLAFSPDGKWLAAGGNRQEHNQKGISVWDIVSVWDVTRRRKVYSLAGKQSPEVKAVAFSRDGQRVFAVAPSRSFAWSTETRDESLDNYDGHELVVANGRPLWINPRGPFYAYSARPFARILGPIEWNHGFLAIGLAEVAEPVVACAGTGSNQSKLYVLGGKQKFGEQDDGNIEPSLLGSHEQAINAAAFNPDSSRLVTAGASGDLKVWNLATRAEVVSWDAAHVISGVRFSPDGRQIVTWDKDGTVKIWGKP